MKPANLKQGFTLLELVIVLGIVGILVSIAMPAYQSQLAQGRRKHAQLALYELAAWMELSFNQTMQYPQPSQLPSSLKTAPLGSLAETAEYLLAIDAAIPAGREFQLRATPTGRMRTDPCGTFILDSTNTRRIEGAAPGMAAANCWGY